MEEAHSAVCRRGGKQRAIGGKPDSNNEWNETRDEYRLLRVWVCLRNGIGVSWIERKPTDRRPPNRLSDHAPRGEHFVRGVQVHRLQAMQAVGPLDRSIAQSHTQGRRGPSRYQGRSQHFEEIIRSTLMLFIFLSALCILIPAVRVTRVGPAILVIVLLATFLPVAATLALFTLILAGHCRPAVVPCIHSTCGTRLGALREHWSRLSPDSGSTGSGCAREVCVVHALFCQARKVIRARCGEEGHTWARRRSNDCAVTAPAHLCVSAGLTLTAHTADVRKTWAPNTKRKGEKGKEMARKRKQ
jgi:hypothetical protein